MNLAAQSRTALPGLKLNRPEAPASAPCLVSHPHPDSVPRDRDGQKSEFMAATTFGAAVGAFVVLVFLVLFGTFYLMDRRTEEAPGTSAAGSREGDTAAVSHAPAESERTPRRIALADPVSWPDLFLTGVAWEQDSDGGNAIIDGCVVPLGATFKGVKVVCLAQEGAVLEFRGEQRTIPVGGTSG